MKYQAVNQVLQDTIGGIWPEREINSMGRLILEHLTGLSWVHIRLHGDHDLSPDQEAQLAGIIDRLRNREPVQYVLGETEFYGLTFRVRPGVLIPRGETEELVDWIITGYRGQNVRILDIGCGSGAIAVALSKFLPGCEVVAADISPEALQVTGENALLNQTEVSLLALDILHAGSSPDRYDIIVSNPPYVPQGEMTAMDEHVVRFEPGSALFVPDDDPLVFYRAIAGFAKEHLNIGGQVFVEIHDRLGSATAGLFRESFSEVELRQDIHGRDRMIRARNG